MKPAGALQVALFGEHRPARPFSPAVRGASVVMVAGTTPDRGEGWRFLGALQAFLSPLTAEQGTLLAELGTKSAQLGTNLALRGTLLRELGTLLP